MPFLTVIEAFNLKLVDAIPDDKYSYLYDMMMEQFIYIGRPVSPCEIEHIFVNN